MHRLESDFSSSNRFTLPALIFKTFILKNPLYKIHPLIKTLIFLKTLINLEACKCFKATAKVG